MFILVVSWWLHECDNPTLMVPRDPNQIPACFLTAIFRTVKMYMTMKLELYLTGHVGFHFHLNIILWWGINVCGNCVGVNCRNVFPALFIHVYSDKLHSFLSSRFPPHMVPPHHGLHTTGIPHPAIVTPSVKQESSQGDVGLHSSWVFFLPYMTLDLLYH